MKKAIVPSLLVLGVSSLCLLAQVPSASRVLSRLQKDPNAQRGARPQPAPEVPAADASTSAPPAVTQIPVSPLVLALDTNHDGIIDAAEINNATNSLKTLDKNGDGQLTPEEYLAPGEEPPGTSPLIKALDMDGDGVISTKEIAGAPSNLRMLDKNYDGRLGPGEYRPAPGTVPVFKSLQTTNSN